MSVETIPHNGHIIVTELVTDGVDTWFYHETFIDYTEEETRTLFAEHLREKGYELKEED